MTVCSIFSERNNSKNKSSYCDSAFQYLGIAKMVSQLLPSCYKFPQHSPVTLEGMPTTSQPPKPRHHSNGNHIYTIIFRWDQSVLNTYITEQSSKSNNRLLGGIDLMPDMHLVQRKNVLRRAASTLIVLIPMIILGGRYDGLSLRHR